MVLPHDGLCKINGTTAPQDYNDWVTLNYPSIGQVAHALRENDIIPIFAVQERIESLYQVRFALVVYTYRPMDRGRAKGAWATPFGSKN